MLGCGPKTRQLNTQASEVNLRHRHHLLVYFPRSGEAMAPRNGLPVVRYDEMLEEGFLDVPTSTSKTSHMSMLALMAGGCALISGLAMVCGLSRSCVSRLDFQFLEAACATPFASA